MPIQAAMQDLLLVAAGKRPNGLALPARGDAVLAHGRARGLVHQGLAHQRAAGEALEPVGGDVRAQGKVEEEALGLAVLA